MKNLILLVLLSLVACQSAYKITTVYTTDSLGNVIKTIKKERREYPSNSYVEIMPHNSYNLYRYNLPFFYPYYSPYYRPYYGPYYRPYVQPYNRPRRFQIQQLRFNFSILYNMKYHFIYKTTDLRTGKYYIGMHSTNNLDDGYMGSGKRIKWLIDRYGKENFKFEILEHLANRLALAKREKEIVNKKLLNDGLCLNHKVGGEGGFTATVKLKNRIKQIKKSWGIK